MTDLYVREQGHGEPLVYVHGGFASLARRLRPVTSGDAPWKDALAIDHRVISYDRRGCEHSPLIDGGHDPETQAGDLLDLLTEPAHLFASSAGGPIAVIAAAARPDLVRTLTVQGSAAQVLPSRSATAARVRDAAADITRLGARAVVERGVPVRMDGPWARAQAEADGVLPAYLAEQEALRAEAAALPLAVRVAYYRAEIRNVAAYLDVDVTSWAARITAPTLVLHGTRDRIFPVATGRRLAAAIPGARFAAIEGGGHTPVFDNPDALDRMRTFLGTTSTRSRS